MNRGMLTAAVALAALVRGPAWAEAADPVERPSRSEPLSPTAGQPVASRDPGRHTGDEIRTPSQPATQPRYTLRDPGPLRGREVPPIAVPGREPTDYSRWLYGLGALALLVAFYLTTRGRDDSENGRSNDAVDDEADGAAEREADDDAADDADHEEKDP